MSSNAGAKEKDEYIYSAYDQLEWDNSAEGYIFTAEDHPDFKSSTVDMPQVDNNAGVNSHICVGTECISDYVDLGLLKQAMDYYGLKLPKYIMFVEPSKLQNMLGASAWTPSLSSDMIFINIDYYNAKDEFETVEAIAHETWHLTKQPRFIRSLPGFRHEKEVAQIGESVAKLYIKMKEVTTILDFSRKWK